MIESEFVFRTMRRQKILVVDDHLFQRQVLRHQINSVGYDFQNIFEAESGVKALSLCRIYRFNFIFCDLRMPAMDGMALLRHLSEMSFAGSVIISSGLDADVIDSVLRMGEAYGLNMTGAIPKPSRLSQIKELLLKSQKTIQVQNNDAALSFTPNEIRQALDFGEIVPWYQPKVSLKTGEWLGVEALARWYHPKKGIISPVAFIPLVEQYGFNDQLTATMISQSIRCAHLWKQKKVSINLSSQSLLSVDFFDKLLSDCNRWDVSPERVTLEVTEGMLIDNVGRSLEMLSRMRMHGFGLSIDDFGTGYASLHQLTMLPFTELKLDRSFVSRCAQNTTSMAVVEYNLQLAEKLGLRSVAEGVEDENTWRVLAALGCDMCQGYFSGRPMPEEELRGWFNSWKNQVSDMNLAVYN